MDGTKIAAAWKEWLASEEGKQAFDHTTLEPALALGNRTLDWRLNLAFQAGVRFGSNAVADEVIAAMEKEKQR